MTNGHIYEFSDVWRVHAVKGSQYGTILTPSSENLHVNLKLPQFLTGQRLVIQSLSLHVKQKAFVRTSD
jgi:hypothetical protein